VLLFDEREHASEDERAIKLSTDVVDGLDLEANSDQTFGDLSGSDIGRQVDQLAQP
jgi:hypothetical protein